MNKFLNEAKLWKVFLFFFLSSSIVIILFELYFDLGEILLGADIIICFIVSLVSTLMMHEARKSEATFTILEDFILRAKTVKNKKELHLIIDEYNDKIKPIGDNQGHYQLKAQIRTVLEMKKLHL